MNIIPMYMHMWTKGRLGLPESLACVVLDLCWWPETPEISYFNKIFNMTIHDNHIFISVILIHAYILCKIHSQNICQFLILNSPLSLTFSLNNRNLSYDLQLFYSNLKLLFILEDSSKKESFDIRNLSSPFSL